MIDPVELCRTLHGHVGLLAAVALAHPALTLRDTPGLRRGTRWSVALATALVTVTVVAGWALYGGYRRHDKPAILQEAPAVAALFETKEHLAWYALALSWAGLGLVFWARRPRPARLCFAMAAALALAVGILGSVVGSFTASPG
ncbi:MAG: hypothetical protein ACOZNI_01800 [Myxococcota bacterium]